MKKALSILLDILFYGAMLFVIAGATYSHGLIGFFMGVGYVVCNVTLVFGALFAAHWVFGDRDKLKELCGFN